MKSCETVSIIYLTDNKLGVNFEEMYRRSSKVF